MMFKKCLILACVASSALAQQVGNIFCQARYITNVATCVIGVKECNIVESFSNCVCANSGQKDKLRLCLVSMLGTPEFRGILQASDYLTLSTEKKVAE
jgi:hypothetical protein